MFPPRLDITVSLTFRPNDHLTQVGTLDHRSAAETVRSFFKHNEVGYVQGHAVGLDTEKKTVAIETEDLSPAVYANIQARRGQGKALATPGTVSALRQRRSHAIIVRNSRNNPMEPARRIQEPPPHD